MGQYLGGTYVRHVETLIVIREAEQLIHTPPRDGICEKLGDAALPEQARGWHHSITQRWE